MDPTIARRTASPLAVLAALAALLAVGLVGLYYYDASRSDLIAEGVRSGGVDLGGLRAPEAVDKLRRAVAAQNSSDQRADQLESWLRELAAKAPPAQAGDASFPR